MIRLLKLWSEFGQTGLILSLQYGNPLLVVVVSTACLVVWPLKRLVTPTNKQREAHAVMGKEYGRLKATELEFKQMYRDIRRAPRSIQAFLSVWAVLLIAAIFELPGVAMVGGSMSLAIILAVWAGSVDSRRLAASEFCPYVTGNSSIDTDDQK